MHRAFVVAQVEAHVEAAQGDALDHFFEVIELGALGPHEFAPRRRVEKQIAHFHRGAGGMGGGRGFAEPLAVAVHPPAAFAVHHPRGQTQPRHRTDTRQGLAAETEAAHRDQIVEAADLAGGVAAEGQGQIVAMDAAAVVAHADEAHPALPHLDVDAARPGVEAVFHQLFDDRRRPLHHFAGGDLIGEDGGQELNTCGGHERRPASETKMPGIIKAKRGER